MNIEVSDEISLQLEQLAKERRLTMDELISVMLDGYDFVRSNKTLPEPAENAAKANLSDTESDGACPPYLAKLAIERGISPEYMSELLEKEYPPGSMGRLAQVAVKAGMASKERVDTAVQSREILNTEYADYLKKRRTTCQ
ncbi:MAG: hypothetical protein OXG53_03360 [Chloroflexi bacterium]|nr:hypothetical protein [Chloroflexota bacterium]